MNIPEIFKFKPSWKKRSESIGFLFFDHKGEPELHQPTQGWKVWENTMLSCYLDLHTGYVMSLSRY